MATICRGRADNRDPQLATPEVAIARVKLFSHFSALRFRPFDYVDIKHPNDDESSCNFVCTLIMPEETILPFFLEKSR